MQRGQVGGSAWVAGGEVLRKAWVGEETGEVLRWGSVVGSMDVMGLRSRSWSWSWLCWMWFERESAISRGPRRSSRVLCGLVYEGWDSRSRSRLDCGCDILELGWLGG